MASNSPKPHETEAIKEVIRLLHAALDDCYRLLGEDGRAERDTKQDNEPPN